MTVLLALLQIQAPPMAPPPPPPPPPFPLLAFGDALGLSPEQRQAITTLLAAHRESLRLKHRAVDEAREAHRAGMEDPATSAADLEALQQRVAAAQRQEFLEAHALLQEASRLLRPDQLETYARLRAQRPRHPQGPPPGFQEGHGSAPPRPGEGGFPPAGRP